MKNLTLEVSLKPFYGLDASALLTVCEQALGQWRALIERTDTVSILFWAADGSEILDYNGDLDQEMEWARYIGNANAHIHPHIPSDPENRSLHARSYLYREDAQPITYRRFAQIIQTWRKAITALGKAVRIGLTFDPGGEFSPSSFKYERHREICLANTMGKASFACCYGVLHADDRAYAGFPGGIPEGTSMGTFLGRQFQSLAKDLRADYLWLSNGFGFGMETWMTVGPLFDGKHFHPENASTVRDEILSFWRDFRRECPTLAIETRGTNLGTGTDLASDATPLRELYEGDFNFAPPPNSPWAAINGDFGLEMTGYLSRIAELPPGRPLPFRFYIHDPWWLNSPWLDRYERQAHDIYLPLATARLSSEGLLETADTLNLLTIDDSYGQMPEAVPNEVIPHLLRAWDEQPDAAGPFVWLYPFDELHEAMFSSPQRPERLFHVDWFMREAINHGFPLNTVLSTRTLQSLVQKKSDALRGRILVSPAPFDAAAEALLLSWIDSGEKVIVYGPLGQAPEMCERLGLIQDTPLSGQMEIQGDATLPDRIEDDEASLTYEHRPLMSGGGLEETPQHGCESPLRAQQGENTRALIAKHTTPSGGCLCWLRGPLPLKIEKDCHLPVPDVAGSSFPVGKLIRKVITQWGWHIGFHANDSRQKQPVLALHRHDNAWLFSGYTPDTTVGFSLKTPWGAPILLGQETRLQNGSACFHQQRGWRNECRVFVDQSEGLISHREELPGQMGVTRRMWVHGLCEATLRFFPPIGFDDRVTARDNPEWPFISGKQIRLKRVDTPHGTLLETLDPTNGTILLSW